MASYSTTFPNTETPLSEGGNFGNAASGTWTNPVRSLAGSADGNGSSGVNDAISVLLSGSWARTQSASITAKIVGTPTGNPEIEPHIHMSITTGPDAVTTYEGDGIWNSNKWDLIIARWDSTQGAATVIGSASALVTPLDGDVMTLTDDGSGNMTFDLNGGTSATATDTTYTGGRPGLGFDQGAGSGVTAKAYSATDGVVVVIEYTDPAMLI